MRRSLTSGLPASAAVLLVLTAVSCSESPDPPAAGPNASTSSTVRLAPENVAVAKLGRVTAGPTVSGQLTPAREATVRSQVGGSIIALPLDRGQRVLGGAEVARISSRDLETNLASAETAVKSAETALAVARSEEQRTEALVKGGAVASRDLEQARNNVANAEAQVAAARARQRSAWQQLDDTSVKAPFSGVIRERPASLGDVVAPGTEILTIIDPSSMRLEALVPSDQIDKVVPGANVHFTVRGVPGELTGRVDRLSASADPVTRQISMFVTLPNASGRLIAGLFAEGRVETETREGLVIPLAAVDETGPVPTATRIRGGKAERVALTLGARQSRTEQVEVVKGLAAGDEVIVGSAKGIANGTPVQVVK